MFDNKIFKVTDTHFFDLAFEVYQYQTARNRVFKLWVEQLNISQQPINGFEQFPFLPISAYRRHKVVCDYQDSISYKVFKSSGTSQGESNRSLHYIKDLKIYDKSIALGFKRFMGDIGTSPILALLPSYLENSDSSLIYMVNYLMQMSNHKKNKFYKKNFQELYEDLIELQGLSEPILLFSVSYALIDFVNDFPCNDLELTVINTGGLKGRLVGLELSEITDYILKKAPQFKFYEEYSMCELLSQAYKKDTGNYQTPAWMKILVADIHNPLDVKLKGRGQICIIDLANFNTCSFIATEDFGEVFEDGSFRILGRIDDENIRGCSQLVL